MTPAHLSKATDKYIKIQYINLVNHGVKTPVVISVTARIVALLKDQTAPFLSTDCASKLITKPSKNRLSSLVKAVNRTSSCQFSQLSHFSVDKLV
ncbi:hypothetical protein EBL_c07990 [Shimwellia blattae DSM 4481 = NBRC 105725]|uniref:Uncharacterized protein n=1 Tax=Shimwellia blattae (strain ATCC 29907 / DSM 4481 / JCM 1650 / NBRC 105725 / CDC 9005-74) TaxID=630626 RepID=I2B5W8_SHIBC|nr:hypothetical protein EBL_c07990 [Shimwellia blattae DSM 4481 = NBRC 105725]